MMAKQEVHDSQIDWQADLGDLVIMCMYMLLWNCIICSVVLSVASSAAARKYALQELYIV